MDFLHCLEPLRNDSPKIQTKVVPWYPVYSPPKSIVSSLQENIISISKLIKQIYFLLEIAYVGMLDFILFLSRIQGPFQTEVKSWR